MVSPVLAQFNVPDITDISKFVPDQAAIQKAGEEMGKCLMTFSQLGECSPLKVVLQGTVTDIIPDIISDKISIPGMDSGEDIEDTLDLIADLSEATINAICKSRCISSIPKKQEVAMKCLVNAVKVALPEYANFFDETNIDLEEVSKASEMAEKLICSKDWFDKKPCTRFIKDIVTGEPGLCKKAKCCVGTVAEAFEFDNPCGGTSSCPAPGQSSQIVSFSFLLPDGICKKAKILEAVEEDAGNLFEVGTVGAKIDNCLVTVKHIVPEDFSGTLSTIVDKVKGADAFPTVSSVGGVDFSATVQDESLETVVVPKLGENTGSIAVPSLLLTSLLMFLGSQN